MQRSWLQKVLLLPAVLISVLAGAGVAQAPSVTYQGRVTGNDGQPLAGASVGITELEIGSITNADGQYNFSARADRSNGRTITIVARHIGYKPGRYTIRVSGPAVQHDFVLERDILQLNEVVVTGTSAATEKTKTPFSVAVIDNQQIKEVPSASPVGVLAGKIPGAEVVTTSGQPGSEPAIRLRSATSLTGRQDPLIIVDGVITNLSMADINSEDIDRVEVIKGAAASSLYGSNAANGVIQIFTKRGANLGEGQTSWTARTEYGASKLPRLVPTNQHHPYKMADPSNASKGFDLSSGSRTSDNDLIADNPYPIYYDQFGEVFRAGQAMTNYISVGQRQGKTNFNVSFENAHDQGVLRLLDGYRRENFRVNVDQALTDKLDLGAGAFYGRSTSKQADNSGGIFFGMRFLEPNVNIDSIVQKCPPNTTCSFIDQYNPLVRQPPLSGNVDNPLYDLQVLQKDNNRDRFTGTFRASFRPTDWLTADGNVGYDEANQAYRNLTPFGYTTSTGSKGNGSLYTQNDNNREYNTGISLTSVRDFGFVHNTTKLAASYEDQTNSDVNVYASKLTVPHVPEYASADPSATIRPASRDEVIRAKNVFAISTFDIKDRYIIDGLVRRDQSSLFGAEQRSAVYQRISGAWRVTQDFRIPGVDELKLHASDGTAGLRPGFDAQYETFTISGGHPVKVNLGNSKLRPAFSRETEYGATLNFRRNYSLDYTYSRKRTTDEIIQVPLSAASGYQSQWQNAGTLSGRTHELALGAVLLSARDYFWRLSVTGDRTRQKIEDLNVPPFLVGPDGTTNMFRIAPNQPFGIIYGEKWVRTEQQLEETIKAGRLTGAPSDYVVNEEGFYVKKAQYHTVSEVPLKAYVCEKPTSSGCGSVTSNQIIGDVNPDFNMGFNSTVTYKGLSLTGTLTLVKGGNIYNMTRQWPFNELRDPVFDQSKKAPTTCAANWPTADPTCPYTTGKKPTSYYSTFYDAITPNDYFVENGTYWRLRELAVNYTIPARLLNSLRMRGFHSARIGFVGRNLWTHTKYSGYDPDVTGPNGDPFSYRVDYFSYPAYRTITGMIELGY